MGCRPSRASLGRVGDSSWEYNKNFIKEHKEKKVKNKKSGRGGRRKAPVYNDFSSTSKTYTNLNSKSSKITVRLSTDGSTLEIEQYDIDLNACVDKYRADVDCVAKKQVLSPNQAFNHYKHGQILMKRSYSAPSLSYIPRNGNNNRTSRCENNETNQHSSNKDKLVLVPKKSKSVTEKGFLAKTNGWCDRKHIHDVTADVIHHTSLGHNSISDELIQQPMVINSENVSSCNNLFCDTDVSVVDIEGDQGMSDGISASKTSLRMSNSKPGRENDPTNLSVNSNTIGVQDNKHCSDGIDNTCCSIRSGAAVNNHLTPSKLNMYKQLGVADICQCSKQSITSNVEVCHQDGQTQVKSETGARDLNSHTRQQVVKVWENRDVGQSQDKSMDNDVILKNQRQCVLADENSNLNENVVCECQAILQTKTKKLSSVGCLDTLDSENMKRLISDIDFSRRRFVLPTQSTNGFKNGDIYTSMVQSLDPESIRSTHDSELSPNNQNASIFSRGCDVTRHTEQYETGDNFSCSKISNSGTNFVSMTTADKLMGLTEGNNYGSGPPSDYVFLMQTTSPKCRMDELDADLYFKDRNHLYEDTDKDVPSNGSNKAFKYITSVDDDVNQREDNSPEFEESLDESFEKRFDFPTCSRLLRRSPPPNDDGNDADDYDEEGASSSDFEDEEFLDALESTYV